MRNTHKKHNTREFISVIKTPLVNILGSETMFPNYSPWSNKAMNNTKLYGKNIHILVVIFLN